MAEIEKSFYNDIANLLDQARRHVQRTTNAAMVYAYYEIGRRIVEEEQHGEERAQYGRRVLAGLSQYLTVRFGKGFSEENLKLMRRFYRVYSADENRQTLFTESAGDIRETVFTELAKRPTASDGNRFFLSWSHYLKLMRISNPDERRFYEIEAARNEWSLSELNRQTGSALYERLALSRDKEKVRELAEKGQVVQTPARTRYSRASTKRCYRARTNSNDCWRRRSTS